MMADALTGVVIISLMIAVCLATIKICRAASATASNTKSAQTALMTALETTPRRPGSYVSAAGGVTTRVEVRYKTVNGIALCHMVAVASPDGGRHSYRLSGTRWCEKAPA